VHVLNRIRDVPVADISAMDLWSAQSRVVVGLELAPPQMRLGESMRPAVFKWAERTDEMPPALV